MVMTVYVSGPEKHGSVWGELRQFAELKRGSYKTEKGENTGEKQM